MKNFLDFYRYLFRDNSYWFKAVVLVFVGTAIVGAMAFASYPQLLETIIEGFEERFGANPALDFDLALQIFLQNMVASGVALFGGIILGLGPLLVVGVNGLLIGYVLTWLMALNRGSVTDSLVLILGGLAPHGILEIPAFLIAAALGLRLGWEWMSDRAAGNRWPIFKQNVKRTFFSIPAIALMLFIAAIIEVFVSGNLVS